MENAPMIFKQICAVMSEINAIGKDRKNQQQNFQYRGIDDVMNEMHGVLAKCKVFVVPEVLEEARTTGKTKSGGDMFYTRLKIRFTFYTEDGSSVQSVVIGEAMDTADKASNKALSVGLKYALLQVFCIPTEDEKDPDAQSPEPKPGTMGGSLPPQVQTVKDAFNGEVVQVKRTAPKLTFEPKGGETTPEEKKEISNLLSSKGADGKPLFSKEEAKAYSNMRKELTAAELIARIKQDLQTKLNAPKTAGDVMRENASAGQPGFDIY